MREPAIADRVEGLVLVDHVTLPGIAWPVRHPRRA